MYSRLIYSYIKQCTPQNKYYSTKKHYQDKKAWVRHKQAFKNKCKCVQTYKLRLVNYAFQRRSGFIIQTQTATFSGSISLGKS